MYKKILCSLFLFLFTLFTNAYAEHIEVTASMLDNVLSIEIVNSPEYSMTVEQKATENEVIQKITNKNIIIDNPNGSQNIKETYKQLNDKYDIEEITKDNQIYWKCTPKNLKIITVKKARSSVYTDSQGDTIHSTEYYDAQIPNPSYISDKNELDKKIIYIKVTKKND